MEMTSTFAPISKTAEQEDGSLLVYGKATDDSLDLDDQRCDPAWLNEAMPAWFGTGTGVGGNIRAQHRADSAVGKAIEHEAAADGHYITARIVDRDAIAKTKAGVFTGFSIGIRRPKIIKSPTAANGVIAGGMITEVSLCDRPANPACTLTLCKAAKPGMRVSSGDFDAERLLVKCEEYTEKTVEPDLNKADGMTVTLAEQVSPEVAEKLDAITEDVEKATDVEHLEAPAPGQVCVNCGEDGHLTCGEKAADVEVPVEAIDKATDAPCCDQCGAPGDGCCDMCPPVAKSFDMDAAKALVAETVAKADSGLGQDESGDIDGASQAISIIAQLIQSEAKDLADTPAQGCDIDLLMQAVHALRIFTCREAKEQAGIDPGPAPLLLAAEVDKAETVQKARYSAEQLRQMLADGKAMKNPDGDPSYPIADKEDLSNAINAVGRGKGDHSAIRAFIMRRAKALGAADMIPDNWSSSKAADTEETMTEEALDKAIAATEAEAEAVVGKTTDPGAVEIPAEVVKTVTEETSNEETLIKAFTSSLEKADNPLRKMLAEIVEASAKTTAKSLSELGERLVKVEGMAIPGGPTLRRTEVERVQSRKQDLEREALRYKALSNSAVDNDLRRGYAAKAAQMETEIKAL
jgi:hypothetical protein